MLYRMPHKMWMKSVSSVLIAAMILCLTAPVFAQNDVCPQLANHPEKERLIAEYTRSRLSVGVGALTLNPSARVPSTVDPSTWRYWSVYRNDEPLSEAAFFEVCGREKEAALARGHYASANRLIGTGTGLMMVSIIGVNVGLAKAVLARSDESDWGPPVIWVSLGTGGVSFLLQYLGYSRRHKSWATYGRAKAVADEYNLELCRKLSEDTQ